MELKNKVAIVTGATGAITKLQQILLAVTPIEVERGHLTCSVDSGVRPPGHQDRASGPPQCTQGGFKFALDSAHLCLPLAT